MQGLVLSAVRWAQSGQNGGDNNVAIGAISGRRGGPNPAILLSCAVVALALPSAVLAFTSNFDAPTGQTEERGDLGALHSKSASDSPNARFARAITMRNLTRGQMFRFTPADSGSRPDRAVTVAVRVDPQTARVISVRAGTGDPSLGAAQGGLRIAPTAYSLGVSRGFQNFSLAGEGRRGEAPDLSAFRLRGAGADEPSRLNARIALDQRERAGRAPRTLEANGEQTVDVGGSFSLTRNFDVTAGVRYSQDRDRLLPQVDGQKDSQAVYVGTQFRF